MISSKLFGAAMIIYIIAALIYVSYLVFRNVKVGNVATLVTFIGLIIHTAALISRTVASFQKGSAQPPFTNLYSSMVFFSWSIILIYLILEFKFKQKTIGAFVTPIAFACLGFATLLSDQIEPLVPALQSNWLLSHVITCFFGYAAFAVAFGISIMYLIRVYFEERSTENTGILKIFPPSDLLDELLELVAHDAEVLGCSKEIVKLRDIITSGNSADRQRAVFKSATEQGADHTRTTSRGT